MIIFIFHPYRSEKILRKQETHPYYYLSFIVTAVSLDICITLLNIYVSVKNTNGKISIYLCKTVHIPRGIDLIWFDIYKY